MVRREFKPVILRFRVKRLNTPDHAGPKLKRNSGWLVWLLVISSCTPCLFHSRPHIILIIVDDLGWNDISLHGSPQVPTPNIDALAADGIVLNNYYVSPLCSPSRGALMTGMYPIHTGLQHYVIVAGEPWGLPLHFTTMPQHFQCLGYTTHAIGKWHLGFFRKEYTPTFRGFDSHFGYWTGCEDYYDHTALTGGGWGLDFHDNLTTVTDALGKYATSIFTEKATKIIEQNQNTKPLFLMLAHLAVHAGNSYAPLQAPKYYIDRFKNIKNTKRRKFAGMVAALDDSVGLVVEALHKANMLNNSIIVLTSDNGGAAAGIDNSAASNWPLRGTKFTLWEGGIKGSALLWSPLLEKGSGRVAPQMMHISDWLPTLYHAAGGLVSDLGKLDGVQLWDALSQNLPSQRTEILHNIDPIWKVAALRVGDFKLLQGTVFDGKYDKWFGPSGRTSTKNKYHMHNTSEDIQQLRNMCLNSVTAKYLKKIGRSISAEFCSLPEAAHIQCEPKPTNASRNCQPNKNPCVYNIKEDPCEYNNLAQIHPEITSSLLQRLQEFNKTAVTPGNKPADPFAVPLFHDFTWVNWMDKH
ncbi:arylsulfatase B-like isoform X2 [Tachypleus tridentatus]|uniref:arylsulfatase B-like isoform X2 n=2 Tax=Tachypleus tridentatus TaxID=6853 RepID=UPI003FD11A01